VPEQLLDDAQIGAAAQELGCESVSKGVGMGSALEAGTAGQSFDRVVDGPGRDWPL
jgi:hypothetical protein